ncbi:T9SS type A sorting domain-containing protein [Adhaeribacter arboris]|uniref:T9SS type A sorting domain-containing protein n=1 Tax=Adhaeribacter arboris TaxID=2072846 RepID=UPI001304A35D|nr:T9SS type A sorting domain-containing protein [Adhaeribacter arboris]
MSIPIISFAQNKIWDKTIGGNNYDNLSIVQQTKDGGYILGGTSLSGKSGDKSEDNKGRKDELGNPISDYWIVKLRADGTKEWDKTIGGDSRDELSSLQQTSDGGYILGGTSLSSKSGDKTEASKGGSDYWIVKLDSNGKKQWDKTIGGSKADNLTSLKQTNDGGYILGGSSYSKISGDKTEGLKGNAKVNDYWIVKVDGSGNKVWDKTIGGNREDYLTSVLQTSDGGYILGGWSLSDKSGDKSQANKNNYDYWIVKLDGSGKKEWDKTIGGTDDDYLTSLQQTSDGGYILGGYSYSKKSGDKSEDNKGRKDEVVYILPPDYWIVKLKADGSKEWDKTIGGDSRDELSSVQQAKDKGYILGGTSYSGKSGDKTQENKGECNEYGCSTGDYWVVKLSASGNKVWDKTFGGKGLDNLHSVQLTKDGGYILGGLSVSGKKGDKTEASKGGSDYWIVKLDNSGDNLYSQTVTFEPIINKTLGEAPFALSATASSGLPITFKVVSGPAKVQGNVVTLTGIGTVTVKASVAGNGTYQPADTTRTFEVEAPSIVKKEWDKTIGGSYEDFLTSVQQTRDGGYIMGGWSQSGKSGDKSENCKGEYDYWIVKLNENGEKQWDKTLGGMGSEQLTSIQQTSDGGYILGGYSNSGISGDKSEANRGNYDYWVVKLNASGNKVWDKAFGGNSVDYLTSLQQTSDGSYILGGYSFSGKSGDKSEAKKGSEDYWVIKLNASGNKVWDKTIGGNYDDKLTSLQQTSDGGFILGGTSDSGISGDKSQDSYINYDGQNSSDYWIVKLKADGTKEWDKTFGGDSNDLLASLQPTIDGGYIMGGTSNSGISGDKTDKGIEGSYDYWVVRLNVDGTKLWDKTIGGTSTDYFASLQQTHDGGYILGGSSDSGIGGDKSEAKRCECSKDYFTTDYWIVKLKADGTKAWDKTLGGNNDDYLRSVQHTRDGNYILGGSSNSGKSYEKSQANKGGNDYWIVKLSAEQSLTAQWNMRYGGMGKDNFTTVIKTSDGGYLSGGYTTSGVSGDKSQSSQGKNDYWVVKSDKNGKKLWEKSYGGSSDDYLNSMVQTSDGGYLLGGSSISGVSGDKTQASQGERDYWILKIDKQGTKLWDKTYGGSGTEELKKVILLPSGSFILAGTSNSPVSGAMSQESKGGQDYWFVKVNATGKKMWNKRYGGSQDEVLEDLALTLDGGFLLGGTSTSGISGDKSEASKGGKDFWLVRISGTGEKVWDKTYGGSQDDELRALGSTNTSSGNFFVAGTSSSGKSGDKSQVSQGGKDYWMLKINGSGKKLWDKRFGGSQEEELRTIQLTQDGGYLLGGSSHSGVSGDKNQSSQGSKDYWLVKTTDKGEKEWDQRLGGSGTEELRTVFQTKDGGYVLGGRSDSGVSGDRTQPSQGSTDYWLVKLAPLTTSMVAAREETGAELKAETDINLLKAYPNPFREIVSISFNLPTTQVATIQIYDIQGRVITTLFQEQAQANQIYQVEWQAGNKPAGLYLLQLQTPTQQHQQKLLLTK